MLLPRHKPTKFECVECGFEENADVVGAINVLRAGHARLACEVSGAYAASSRNPPKRLTRGIAPPLSAVGISGLQAGEDVNFCCFLIVIPSTQGKM